MLNLKTLNIVIIININKKILKGVKTRNWELPLKSCHRNICFLTVIYNLVSSLLVFLLCYLIFWFFFYKIKVFEKI